MNCPKCKGYIIKQEVFADRNKTPKAGNVIIGYELVCINCGKIIKREKYDKRKVKK